ncbi:MAG: hypothetical protein ACI80I_002755 [Akkermansiaceae bacterium]
MHSWKKSPPNKPQFSGLSLWTGREHPFRPFFDRKLIDPCLSVRQWRFILAKTPNQMALPTAAIKEWGLKQAGRVPKYLT